MQFKSVSVVKSKDAPFWISNSKTSLWPLAAAAINAVLQNRFDTLGSVETFDSDSFHYTLANFVVTGRTILEVRCSIVQSQNEGVGVRSSIDEHVQVGLMFEK